MLPFRLESEQGTSSRFTPYTSSLVVKLDRGSAQAGRCGLLFTGVVNALILIFSVGSNQRPVMPQSFRFSGAAITTQSYMPIVPSESLTSGLKAHEDSRMTPTSWLQQDKCCRGSMKQF